MKQNAVRFRVLFLLSVLLFTLCLNKVIEGAEESELETEKGNELVGEMMKGVEDAMAQHKKRKKALEVLVRKPLTETQQKLLRQLSEQNGTLDEVLSSKPYLAYLKAETGKEYTDFSAYIEAMPTPKGKMSVLFSLKEALPPNTKVEVLSICTDYYFKLRSLLVKEPNILENTNALVSFQTKHLMEPLMATYPADEMFLHMSELMQMSMVPTLTAQMHTEVFHSVWQERLEKHGLLEGLLQCAIATPTEFTLVRSFFEDTAAHEKWIQTPLKVKEEGKNRKKID